LLVARTGDRPKEATGFFLAIFFQMAIKNSLFIYLLQIGEDLVFFSKTIRRQISI
jgi:hypothetical protein